MSRKIVSKALETAFMTMVSATPSILWAAPDFHSMPKIDVHVHINSVDQALISQARADNFKILSINVDYPDFPSLSKQLAVASDFRKNAPDVLAFAGSFEMGDIDNPGWQNETISTIEQAAAKGAVAIKFWKNIGMQARDHSGHLVMIDDPRFDPIITVLRSRHLPMIGHQGEPKNCWLPIDEMTVNGDREYFREHPQYHMFLHPEFPSYEDQMAARDHFLARNPGLRFMGAHMASLEWSVDELAKFLDAFPDAVVDTAARMGQLQSQSQKDYEKVRQFFIRYQDRILYGSDLTQNPDADFDSAAFRSEAHAFWLSDWNYLAGDAMQRVDALDSPVRGLSLPTAVLEKIYYRNALRFFPNAWAIAQVQNSTQQ